MKLFRREKFLAVGRPGVVAEPAETRDAFAEFFGDGRRQPRVHIFETALPGVAFGRGVQRKQPLPAFARSARARIEQQIRFRSQAQQRRAENSTVPFSARTRNFCRTENLFLRGAGLQPGIAQSGRFFEQKGCRPKGRRYVCVGENELRDEQWIAWVRERVVKTLCRVNGAQRV